MAARARNLHPRPVPFSTPWITSLWSQPEFRREIRSPKLPACKLQTAWREVLFAWICCCWCDFKLNIFKQNTYSPLCHRPHPSPMPYTLPLTRSVYYITLASDNP